MTGAPQMVSAVVVLDEGRREVGARLRALRERLSELAPEHELLVVDNATRDPAVEEVRELMEVLPDLRLVSLSRRSDAEGALLCGVERAIGDVVLTMRLDPVDLELLPQLLSAAATHDLVLAGPVRGARSLSDKLTVDWPEAVARRLAGVTLDLETPPTRAMSRAFVTFLLRDRDPGSLLMALPSIADYPTARILRAGATGPRGSLSTRVDRAVRALLRVTAVPLRLATLLCVLAAGLNVAYAMYVVLIFLTLDDVQKGWTTLSLQVSGMFFLFSLVLALLSEYVVRIFQSSVSTPPYHVGSEERSGRMSREERLNVLGPDR